MNLFKRYFNLLVIFLLFFVVAPGQAIATQPDEYIVELYDLYCHACHSNKATGAPLAFEPSSWDKPLSDGIEVVISRAIKGAGNMPAQGGCMECGYEDFEDLIAYMSQSKPE